MNTENTFSQRPDIGLLFTTNNNQWRVTSTTNRFVIATRSDIDGEPCRASDVIKLNINNSDKGIHHVTL